MFNQLNGEIYRRVTRVPGSVPMAATAGAPSRFDIAIQYLTSFSDRLYGFRVSSLLSLVSFATGVLSLVDFSPISADFENALLRLKGGGDSALWDAIAFCLGELERVRATGQYRNASKYRVLVFSDGCDAGSTIDKVGLANRLLATNVIVDSVHLTTKGDECGDLARLSVLTGGFSFKPADVATGLRIFEKESFLSARLRPPRPRAAVGLSLAAFAATEIVFDAVIENTSLIHVTRVHQRLQTARFALSQDAKAGRRQEGRGRRVLDELLAFTRNPVPGIEIYLQAHTIFEWKVYIQPPDGTPYGTAIWPLTILFGNQYPAEPPLLRFSTIPYHLNVSEDGIVCLDIVTCAYLQTLTVREILVGVRRMFQTPQPQLAVQIEKLLNSMCAKPEYRAAAAASVALTVDNMATWLLGVKVEDDPSFAPAGPRPPPPPEPEPEPVIDYPADVPVRLFAANGDLLVPVGDDDVI
jgi:ubiquitin-protein ligase